MVEVFIGGWVEFEIVVVEVVVSGVCGFVFDVIVGLGGGSNMDVVKFVVVVLVYGGYFWDYFGIFKVFGLVILLICVFIILGIGSEVLYVVVFMDVEN